MWLKISVYKVVKSKVASKKWLLMRTTLHGEAVVIKIDCLLQLFWLPLLIICTTFKTTAIMWLFWHGFTFASSHTENWMSTVNCSHVKQLFEYVLYMYASKYLQ